MASHLRISPSIRKDGVLSTSCTPVVLVLRRIRTRTQRSGTSYSYATAAPSYATAAPSYATAARDTRSSSRSTSTGETREYEDDQRTPGKATFSVPSGAVQLTDLSNDALEVITLGTGDGHWMIRGRTPLFQHNQIATATLGHLDQHVQEISP